jgi:hypothetical protein
MLNKLVLLAMSAFLAVLANPVASVETEVSQSASNIKGLIQPLEEWVKKYNAGELNEAPKEIMLIRYKEHKDKLTLYQAILNLAERKNTTQANEDIKSLIQPLEDWVKKYNAGELNEAPKEIMLIRYKEHKDKLTLYHAILHLAEEKNNTQAKEDIRSLIQPLEEWVKQYKAGERHEADDIILLARYNKHKDELTLYHAILNLFQ